VFVQKFKFILMKMHKNCCHQSCSFWLRYASNRSSAGALPQTGGAYSAPPNHLADLGGEGRREGRGQGGRRRKGRGGEGKGEEGVPECPNPELGSLVVRYFYTCRYAYIYAVVEVPSWASCGICCCHLVSI